MNNRFFLDNLWRWKCGMEEFDYDTAQLPSVNFPELVKSEWSDKFEQLMRNRLILGSIRYGKMGHGSLPAGKPYYNRPDSIRKRLKLFEESGNTEYLVDIANFCLLMFEENWHPKSHFESIDDGIHDTIIS